MNIQEKASYSSEVNEMFTIDVNMDSLKDLLQNITNNIKSQAQQIVKLQKELKTKVKIDDFEYGFRQVNNALVIKDQELLKKSTTDIKDLSEQTDSPVINCCNKSCNLINRQQASIQYIYNNQLDYLSLSKELQQQVPTKINRAQMKEKVKKTKGKIMLHIDDIYKKLNNQIIYQKKEIKNNIDSLDDNMRNVEKQTVWKIQEHEKLLNMRVTQEYVDMSIKMSEEKAAKNQNRSYNEANENIIRNIQKNKDSLEQFIETTHESIKELKKKIRENDDKVETKYTSLKIFDENNKLINQKINDLQNKILEVERRGNPQELLNQCKMLIFQLEQQLDFKEKSIQKNVQAINEINVKLEMTQLKQSKAANEAENSPESHRICYLESQIKVLKVNFEDFNRLYSRSESDTNKKITSLEHRLTSELNNILNKAKSSSSSDVELMVQRGQIMNEEKIKFLQQQMEEQRKELNYLKGSLSSLKKKVANIPDNSQFEDILHSKADAEPTTKDIDLLKQSMMGIEDLIQQFRKEFDNIDEFYRKLQHMMKINQKETVSIITGNNRIIPNKCLSCGIKGQQQYDLNEMRGLDGKIYKADVHVSNINGISQANVYEKQDVYDLMPSQLNQEFLNQSTMKEDNKKVIQSYTQK